MGSISRPRCAPWRPWRLKSGRGGLVQIFGAGLGGQGSHDGAQEAGGSGAATRTGSYAHCGLEDMSANNLENITYFEHSQKERFLVLNQDAPDVTHSEVF